MCVILKKFFSSVFTKENTDNIQSIEPLSNVDIQPLHVTPEIFKKHLSNVKPSAAPGPDKITPRILSQLKEIVVIPLSIIFNKSLATGDVPKNCRVANVTPVFKKGSRLLPENYRPISLTSILCKILESLIYKVIVDHISSLTLLYISNDVFYLGCSKAFDRSKAISIKLQLAK